MKMLVTCPPMIERIDEFRSSIAARGFDLTVANVVQTLSEDELCALVPEHDVWIVGDDPASRKVLTAGKNGRLKVVVKWGVGVDNVDFGACKDLGLPVENTPAMFGPEVADLAVGYLIALSRDLVRVDRSVRAGSWIKPAGSSLAGKTVGIVGFGDIGQHLARRLTVFDLKLIAYDPYVTANADFAHVEVAEWGHRLNDLDFLVFTCALTESSRHMFNFTTLEKLRRGVMVVNVGRGGIIDEKALIAGLESGLVASCALDVFESEPVNPNHKVLSYESCIVGSHNASNTVEAVARCSLRALEIAEGLLKDG